jgi:NAD(P)H-flavin reductase
MARTKAGAATGAPRLNRAWHADHRMPTNATLDQRLDWHVAHAAACGCRAMPASVVDALAERGRRRPVRKR